LANWKGAGYAVFENSVDKAGKAIQADIAAAQLKNSSRNIESGLLNANHANLSAVPDAVHVEGEERKRGR